MLAKNQNTEPSLDDWVSSFYDVYGYVTQPKTVTECCIKIARDVADMLNAERRGELHDVYQRLAQVFCDLCLIIGKCQDQSSRNRISKALSRQKKLSKLVWSRYPSICPYCARRPCVCSIRKIEIEIAQRRERPALEFYKKETPHSRTLNEWIKMVHSIYGRTVYSLTPRDLVGRLMEETIELLSVVSSIDEEGQDRKTTHYGIADFDDALADVFIWMCTVATKLESPSRIFFLTVKDVFCDARKGIEKIQDLQRLDFQATTQKGRVLEEVAKQILSMVPDFEILKNKRTSTSEIDLIIRNKSNNPFLMSLGTHIPVECKSSKNPVSKKEVVDFIDKLRSHRCRCGILVTLSRVTGKLDRDASGKIKEAFNRYGLIFITFTVKDLQRIQMGEDPVRVLYEACEKVMFM